MPGSLEECTFRNIIPLTPNIEGKEVMAIRIYDGDTIWIAYEEREGEFYKINCRLMGLDTAELKSKNPVEKQAAKCARDHLIGLIDGERLFVKLEPKSDKYGRWLGTFTRVSDGLDVNQAMLDTWALPYDGGTKQHEFDWADMLTKNGVSPCQE